MNLMPEEMALIANFRRLGRNCDKTFVINLMQEIVDREERKRRDGLRLIQGGKAIGSSPPGQAKAKFRRATVV